jgi:hypothetical protein
MGGHFGTDIFWILKNIMSSKKKIGNKVEMKTKVKNNKENDDKKEDLENEENLEEDTLEKRKRRRTISSEEENVDTESPKRAFQFYPLYRGSPTVDGVEEVLSSPLTLRPASSSAGAGSEFFVTPAGQVVCEGAEVSLSFVGLGGGMLRLRIIVSHKSPQTGKWLTAARSIGLPDRWGSFLNGTILSPDGEVLVGNKGKYGVGTVEEIVGESVEEMIAAEESIPVGRNTDKRLFKRPQVMEMEEDEELEEEGDSEDENEEDEEEWIQLNKGESQQVAEDIRRELRIHLGLEEKYDFFDETVDKKERAKLESRLKKLPSVWDIPVSPPSVAESKQTSREFERTVAVRQREQLLIAKTVGGMMLLAALGNGEKMVELGAHALQLLAHLATGENYSRIRAREGAEVEKNMRRNMGEPLVRKGQLERLKIRNDQAQQLKSVSSNFFRGGRRFRTRGFGGFHASRGKSGYTNSQYKPFRQYKSEGTWERKATTPQYTQPQQQQQWGQSSQQSNNTQFKQENPKGVFKNQFNKKK